LFVVLFYSTGLLAQPNSDVLRAKELYQSGAWEKSLRLWQKVVRRNPKVFSHHFNLAQNYLQLEKYGPAIKHYRVVAGRSKNLAPFAKYYMGMAFTGLGKSGRAMELFEELVVDPNTPTNLLKRAKAQLNIGSLDDTMELALKAFDRAEYEVAETHFDSLLSEGDDDDILFLLGLCLLAQGKEQKLYRTIDKIQSEKIKSELLKEVEEQEELTDSFNLAKYLGLSLSTAIGTSDNTYLSDDSVRSKSKTESKSSFSMDLHPLADTILILDPQFEVSFNSILGDPGSDELSLYGGMELGYGGDSFEMTATPSYTDSKNGGNDYTHSYGGTLKLTRIYEKANFGVSYNDTRQISDQSKYFYLKGNTNTYKVFGGTFSNPHYVNLSIRYIDENLQDDPSDINSYKGLGLNFDYRYEISFDWNWGFNFDHQRKTYNRDSSTRFLRRDGTNVFKTNLLFQATSFLSLDLELSHTANNSNFTNNVDNYDYSQNAVFFEIKASY